MAAIAANNPILNPSKPLAGNSLLQAAQGLANAQTQPVIQQLAQQIAQNNKQTQGAVNSVAGYYKGLGNATQSGVNQTGQIASGLNSQLGTIGSQEQSQLQGIGDHAMQSLLRYAPQSDGSNSLAQPALQGLATEIARQQGLAAQNQGAFKSFGATQGANYKSLAASNLGTFAAQGEQGLKGIAQAGQLKNVPLSQKIAQTQSAYGSTLANDVGKLRQQEITNGITQQGLGIKQQANTIAAQRNQITVQNNLANQGLKGQEIKVTAQNDLANQNLRLQQINATLNGQNLSHQDRQAALAEKQAISNLQAAAKGVGPKPLPTAQNNSMLTQIQALVGLIGDAQKPLDKNSAKKLGLPEGTKLSESQIRTLLSDGRNPSGKTYNQALIQAAYELKGYGSLDQTTVAGLHAMGIRVAGMTYNGRPVKLTQNYNPNNPKMNPRGTASGAGAAVSNAGNAVAKALGA